MFKIWWQNDLIMCHKAPQAKMMAWVLKCIQHTNILNKTSTYNLHQIFLLLIHNHHIEKTYFLPSEVIHIL